MEFKNIKTSTELINYLDDNARFKDCEFLSHYTNYEKLVKILNGKLLYLGQAVDMNDQLEYQNGDTSIWEKLYFTSLIMNRRETIGMWSVYSLPWENGIKISIPKKALINLIDTCSELHVIGEDNKPTGEVLKIDSRIKLFLSSVSYTNIDSKETRKESLTVYWSSVKNSFITESELKKSELTGYVKDVAWAYEKEMRVKAVLHDNFPKYKKLAISIEPILNELIISSGPLFRGSVQQKLLTDLEDETVKPSFESSIFTNRFKL